MPNTRDSEIGRMVFEGLDSPDAQSRPPGAYLKRPRPVGRDEDDEVEARLLAQQDEADRGQFGADLGLPLRIRSVNTVADGG